MKMKSVKAKKSTKPVKKNHPRIIKNNSLRIGFFEEYPEEKNLSKVSLIESPTRILIAAHSLKEFYKKEEELRRIISKKSKKGNQEEKGVDKRIRIGFWPVLKESYWISPFSNHQELKELYEELKRANKRGRRASGEPLEVLLDLELPILKPILFLKNTPWFLKNKRLIRRLLSEAEELNIAFLTAEYAFPGKLSQAIARFLGISYKTREFGHKRVIMAYTSMIKKKFLPKPLLRRIKNHLKKEAEQEEELRKKGESRGGIVAGLGVIAKGVFDNEPILTPEELKNDLLFCIENNIREVIIFRLGGLNKEYARIINEINNIS